jgi:hypothetical protein|tara:strand:+ start:141 stop:629 length:489 start_codon:yes stop_codon:yes gene_type:complete
MVSRRLDKIKKVIVTKPYVYYFIFIFLLYIFFNVIVNKVYVTKDILIYNLSFGIPYVFFNLLIASLVAVNINLMVLKFKELKRINNGEKGLTSFGVFMGVLGGACPGCFVGLFPAFLGLFGVTASLSVLPLYGIEIQIVSALLLIGSAYLLTNDAVCKVRFD